jgi:hypothetical protein
MTIERFFPRGLIQLGNFQIQEPSPYKAKLKI